MAETIYAICPTIGEQGELMKSLCLGKGCGKGLFGILLSPLGSLMPCKTEECLYEEGSMELGELHGGRVILRKLQGAQT